MCCSLILCKCVGPIQLLHVDENAIFQFCIVFQYFIYIERYFHIWKLYDHWVDRVNSLVYAFDFRLATVFAKSFTSFISVSATCWFCDQKGGGGTLGISSGIRMADFTWSGFIARCIALCLPLGVCLSCFTSKKCYFFVAIY